MSELATLHLLKTRIKKAIENFENNQLKHP